MSAVIAGKPWEEGGDVPEDVPEGLHRRDACWEAAITGFPASWPPRPAPSGNVGLELKAELKAPENEGGGLQTGRQVREIAGDGD